jgi:2'-5' RNA ligase
MRVFTAVDIEDQELLEKLERLQEQLDYGFNNVKKEKMHLTLQFFQDVDREQVQLIGEALENIELEPFKLKVKGTGVFPSKSNPRVIWAGVGSEEVFELKKQVSNHRVPEDNGHDFHPHITLSRVKKVPRGSRKEFRQKLEEFEDREIGETQVDSVEMFESVHNGKSTDYNVLKEKEL